MNTPYNKECLLKEKNYENQCHSSLMLGPAHNPIISKTIMEFYCPRLTAVGKCTPLIYAIFRRREESKPMKLWSPCEVVEWLCEEANKYEYEYEKINLTKFHNVNGSILLKMTKRDFIDKDQDYGNFLFQIVEKYKSNEKTPKEVQSSENLVKPNNKIPLRKCREHKTLHLKKRNKRKKCGRVWEFLRDLLLQPEYCPSIICWENYDEGIFRFVQSDKVAELWGRNRNNPKMTFEKFSRAMRHNYANKFLQSVNGRLVYGFGPKATGWQTDDPNFQNPK